MQRWADVERVLAGLARRELDGRELAPGSETVTPILMAFAGETLRFVAYVREFDKGAYHAALIELLALAAPLDADRLAFCGSGRAWSLDDPVPPVTEDADLRQRVLWMELADGSHGRPRRSSVVLPYDLEPQHSGSAADAVAVFAAQRVVWGERRVMPAAQGWIGSALECAVSTAVRRRLRAPDVEIARQAARVESLGHRLYLEGTVALRLAEAACAREDGW